MYHCSPQVSARLLSFAPRPWSEGFLIYTSVVWRRPASISSLWHRVTIDHSSSPTLFGLLSPAAAAVAIVTVTAGGCGRRAGAGAAADDVSDPTGGRWPPPTPAVTRRRASPPPSPPPARGSQAGTVGALRDRVPARYNRISGGLDGPGGDGGGSGALGDK